jgi:hypothetical protein
MVCQRAAVRIPVSCGAVLGGWLDAVKEGCHTEHVHDVNRPQPGVQSILWRPYETDIYPAMSAVFETGDVA